MAIPSLSRLLVEVMASEPDKPLTILETGIFDCKCSRKLFQLASVAARPLLYLGFGPYSAPLTPNDIDRILTTFAAPLTRTCSLQVFDGPAATRLDECAKELPQLDIAILANCAKLSDMRDIWKAVHPALRGVAVFMHYAEVPKESLEPQFTKLLDKLHLTGRYEIVELDPAGFPECVKAVAVRRKEGTDIASSGHHPDV